MPVPLRLLLCTHHHRVVDMGGNGPHSGLRNESFGLATLGADRFGGLRGTGKATTVALIATGTQLVVTADILGAGGFVTVAPTAQGSVDAAATPVTANCTDHVVMQGLTVGARMRLEITLKDSMIYTLGFSSLPKGAAASE